MRVGDPGFGSDLNAELTPGYGGVEHEERQEERKAGNHPNTPVQDPHETPLRSVAVCDGPQGKLLCGRASVCQGSKDVQQEQVWITIRDDPCRWS